MGYDIGPRIGIDGEKEFKSALSTIESQMKALNAEMKASVTSMQGMDNAEDATAKKTDILTRSIEAGQQKIELIQGQYDRARAKLEELGRALEDARREFGDNSEEALKAETAYNKQAKAVNDLGTKLNNAQADVNNMTRELDDMGKEADDAGDEMEDAGKKGKIFGETMRGVVTGELIVKGLEAMAQAVKRVGEALKDAVIDAAEYADEINALSAQTGIATDKLQEYKYMSGLVDVSVETITGSMRKMINNMYSAQQGTGAAATVFKELGVSVVDANGELRDSEEVFADVIDALGQMTNETERDAYSMKIFGKGAQDLNPLIKAGGDRIRDLADEAHRMGYVLDEESLSSLNAVSDAMDRMKNLTQTVKNQLAVALAPVLEQVAEKITVVIEKIDWNKLAEMIGNVINFLLDHYKAVGVALGVIAAGFAAISIASSPLTLLVAAIVAVITVIILLWTKCEGFRNFILNFVEGIKVIANGIKTGVEAIVGFFKDQIDFAISIIEAVKNAVEAMRDFFVSAGEKIKGVVDGIRDKISSFGAKVIEIKDTIVGALTTAFNFIAELPEKALKIGVQIVTGLWNGIVSKITWLKNKITGFCQNALQAIKDFFGIHSPSTVMRDMIGKMMMLGWQAGIKAGSAGLIKQFKKSGTDMLAVADELVRQMDEKSKELEDALNAPDLEKAQKEMLQSQLDAVKSFSKDFTAALDEIEKKETAMASRLSSYGGLLGKSNSSALGEFGGVRGLTNDIRILGRYQSFFGILEAAGASAQFLADFAETDPEKAVEFAEALLKLSEGEQRQYFAMYDAQKNVENQTEALREQAKASATVLSSLEKENEELERYDDLLKELKAKGAPDSLLAAVVQMDVGEATKYMTQLTSMTGYELDKYIAEWNKKQDLAAKIAREFYADEKDAVIKEFVEQVPEELGVMKDDLYQVGVDAANGLAKGLIDASENVIAAAKTIAEKTRAALADQEEIHSPSKKWAQLGGFMAEGLADGFVSRLRASASNMMQTVSGITSADVERVGAGVVNGIAAASGGAGGGGLTITVPLYLDGREIARAQLRPLLDVAKQEGVSFA